VFVLLGLAATIAAIIILAHIRRDGPAIVERPVGVRPDTPVAFGYGSAWLAIKSRDTRQIVEALGLSEAQPCNWQGGITGIYDARFADSHVFVSPPVEGWTFVVGSALPHPASGRFVEKAVPLVEDLGTRFTEVQYFCTYPELGLFGWARAAEGRLQRAFAWGDDGIVWDRGKLSNQERMLGIKALDPGSANGRGSTAYVHDYPTENHVLLLAGKWGVDPSKLDQVATAHGLGLFARAPARWRLQRGEAPRPAPPTAPATVSGQGRAKRPVLRPVT
jgi:hypothetical protein